MSEDVINRARKNSVKNERKRVIRRIKKIVNYVTILMLTAGIIAKVGISIKNGILSNPDNFSEITYGIDYDKEFDDVNSLIESCIVSCIRVQINDDTHRIKDGNGIDTGKHYYNFTNYDNIFSNFEILMNEYRMEADDINNFSSYISSLSDEERQAILVYYGAGMVDESARESFKNYVGNKLENMTDEEIANLAKNSVHGLTTNYLDNKWTSAKGRS